MKCGKDEGAEAAFVIGKPVKVSSRIPVLNEGKLFQKSKG